MATTTVRPDTMTKNTKGASRRDNRTGSIWPVGNAFRGSIMLGGKRPNVSGRTEAEVRRKLRKLVRDYEAGLEVSTRPTVRTLAESWLDKAAPNRKAASTVERVRGRITTNLIPALGHVRVDKLTADDVEQWLQAEANAGKSIRTIQDYRGDLRQILNWAIRRNVVAFNAAAVAELPTAKAPRVKRAFTRAEYDAVVEACANPANGRYGPYFALMAASGMRPGELDALQWDAIDLDSGTIVIDAGLQRGLDGRPIAIAVTKTSVTNTIKVGSAGVEALRRQRAQAVKDKLVCGEGYADPDLAFVFRNEIGRPYGPSNCRRAFTMICRAAGVRELTPYELRHSVASILIDEGMNTWAVADLLGHKDTRMVERHYRHKITDVVSTATALER
jgi:integrase